MPPEHRRKVAVVLFNLGAPDRPAAIRPFLLNLFMDPAILRIPFFVRALLARVIVYLRVRSARGNYALLGGASPLLDATRDQAAALRVALPEPDVRCFVAMRYWQPFSAATARAVHAWGPDEVILLPLYPQYSTTTTGSSLVEWREAAAQAGLAAATRTICCYAADPAYIASIAAQVRASYLQARSGLAEGTSLRVLFSAHGLPQKIVAAGDPYQWQVEETVASVLSAWEDTKVDWAICYQSRATPVPWIEPSTIAEIERAAADEVAVLLVPIAFVSEHSETLVELDIEYGHLANRLGVPGYFRVPTLDSDRAFIASLAQIVHRALASATSLSSDVGWRICPLRYSGCPCRVEAPTWNHGMDTMAPAAPCPG